jgi:hypothetical protein
LFIAPAIAADAHRFSSDESARERPERIDDADAGNLLAVLQVFGQQVATAADLGRAHDQRVPEAELVAILDAPRLFKDLAVEVQRLPRRERANVRPRRLAIQPPAEASVSR